MFAKLVFNVLAFTFFILMFLNLVRKNDSNYIYLLVLQFIGISVSFLELMLNITFGVIIKILICILSIIIPLIILLIEYKKNINITEILNLFKAEVLIKFKKYETAEKCLLNTIQKYPQSKEAHKKLAEIYEEQDKIEEAIREYEFSIESDYDEKIYLKIGSLYEKNGRNEQAKIIFENIVKESPDNYEASMALGNVLYNTDEFKYALQVYSRILNYYPEKYEIYYALGMTYTMLNDFKKAKENYQRAAEINSILYHAKYALGQLNLMYEDYDEAIKYFEECIDSEEVDAKAYYYLARIAILRGEQDKAVSYANMAIEINHRIYHKIVKDNIFITIIDKINKPDKGDSEPQVKKKKKTNSDIKELISEEHLEKMTKISGKLKNDDIHMIENIKARNEDTEEKNRN